jgi:SAM-dependent methyltransferase
MTEAQPPFNYQYFTQKAVQIGGRVLDYGCGSGQIVALGLERGLDIWGADTFAEYYSAERGGVTLAPQLRGRIRTIRNNIIDFPDGHFDLVLSNQVLEHVTDPEVVIAEVFRVLRRGGLFIAAFPVVETWYEGHVGLYFAHRLPPGSRGRRAYFDLCHRFGRGRQRGSMSRPQWVEFCERTLDDLCFYYPRRRLFAALQNTFGSSVDDISADYMRTRLKDRAKHIPALADSALRFIYHKRAGEVVKVSKSI